MRKLLRDFENNKDTKNNGEEQENLNGENNNNNLIETHIGQHWDERRVGQFVVTDEILGVGSSPVKLARNIVNGRRSAVKVVTKTVLRKRKDARKEIEILSNAEPHENIIRLEQVLEDEMNIYIFTQLYDHGDLYRFMVKHGVFDEIRARTLFRQMAEAVLFCHQRLRLCHHDVKLENFVVDRNFHVALIDFGFAVEIIPGKKITVFDSSPIYSPLEILQKRPHDSSVDTYSLGVCLYYMLSGVYPFNGNSFEELCREVHLNAGRIHFVFTASTPLRDLLTKLLAPLPHRIPLEEVMSHPWLAAGVGTNNS